MSQRHEPMDSLDYFPTPPWATRALFKHVITNESLILGETCLEPACGQGHMSRTLSETFAGVTSSDVFNYGHGNVVDFLSNFYMENSFDWVITNPPFKLAEDFIKKGLGVCKIGVAMLVRTVFIESVGRYNNLFNPIPPFAMAQFSERVPMVKGRVDKKASTATGYCWIVWVKGYSGRTSLVWIPPCRKKLELNSDYSS